MKKVIPKFRHEGEKARFWGTYSPLDYPDKFSEVKEPFGFTPIKLYVAKSLGISNLPVEVMVS